MVFKIENNITIITFNLIKITFKHYFFIQAINFILKMHLLLHLLYVLIYIIGNIPRPLPSVSAT